MSEDLSFTHIKIEKLRIWIEDTNKRYIYDYA